MLDYEFRDARSFFEAVRSASKDATSIDSQLYDDGYEGGMSDLVAEYAAKLRLAGDE